MSCSLVSCGNSAEKQELTSINAQLKENDPNAKQLTEQEFKEAKKEFESLKVEAKKNGLPIDDNMTLAEFINNVSTTDSINQEIDSINQEIQAFNNQTASDLATPTSQTTGDYESILFNVPVIVPDYAEFTIIEAKLKQRIDPKSPTDFHTYYEVKDPNNIYLDVVFDFKNTSTITLNANDITNVKVIYDNTYDYQTNDFVEHRDGSDFTYSLITNIEPLTSATLHYAAELPIEVQTSGKPIDIEFEIYNHKYRMSVR